MRAGFSIATNGAGVAVSSVLGGVEGGFRSGCDCVAITRGEFAGFSGPGYGEAGGGGLFSRRTAPFEGPGVFFFAPSATGGDSFTASAVTSGVPEDVSPFETRKFCSAVSAGAPMNCSEDGGGSDVTADFL